MLENYIKGQVIISNGEQFLDKKIVQKIKSKLEQNLIYGLNVVVYASSNIGKALSIIILEGNVRSFLILSEKFNTKLSKLVINLYKPDKILKIYENLNFSLENLNETACNKSTNFKSTTWYIATSGTSGTPKLVEHSYNSLIKSLFKGEKDKSKIWGLTYSVDKFAGIQVILQCFLSGLYKLITNLLSFVLNFSDNIKKLRTLPSKMIIERALPIFEEA